MPSVDILSLTCFALLAIGYVLFAVLSRVEKTASIIREAWPILHAETVIVATVATSFWIGGWVLQICVLVLATRVGFESASVARLRDKSISPITVAIALPGAGFLASFLPFAVLGGIIIPIVIAGVIALTAYKALSRRAIIDLIVFPVLPMVMFVAASFHEPAIVWMLIAFILVETFDSYALLGGKLLGRTKAFPNLSPNKTIEGLAIGAVMLMITAAIAGKIVADAPIWTAVNVALIVGIFTIVGDLTASRLKRQSDVKDYPQVMAHQGGVLDITDAWIVAGAVLAWLSQIVDLT